MREGGKRFMNVRQQKSTKSQMRAPVSFTSNYVGTFAYTPLLTQRQPKTRGPLMQPLSARPRGDIRRKLQKLEGFAGVNASQLLEVATKVFVNQNQEAKQEAIER
jgi:hypothetical protein